MPTTIFWPDDVKLEGFCYGWTKPAICIAGVLQVDSVRQAEVAIEELCRASEWTFFKELCGGQPLVLGRCQPSTSQSGVRPIITLFNPIEYNLVYYTRHEWISLRFYSLHGLKLDPVNKPRTLDDIALLNLLQQDITISPPPEDTPVFNDTTINQFNASKTIDVICQGRQQDTRFRDVVVRGLPASKRFRDSLSAVSLLLSRICKCPVLPPLRSPILKNVVASIEQLDVRAEQLSFFASEIAIVHHRKSLPIHQYSARYTNFFNYVWLILNDIIMGMALGSFLMENHVVLANMLQRFIQSRLVDSVQWTLHWLNSWPEGLKLNTELSHFYSHSFSGVVIGWGEVLDSTRLYLPLVIYAMGVVSYGGLTFAISFALDMLSLVTLHVSLCYALSTAVYQRALSTAGSLWNLFRGKRYNVLRNRTDSWEYDADQLMLGTILFTLLAFLFPTILAYYAMFAMMRLIVLLMRAGMETLLALLNHFPLFVIMLRFKDPMRLPGGVCFDIDRRIGRRAVTISIKSQPIPISTIFHQYINLLGRLATHYNPLRLLYCLFSGRYLSSIPQYSIRYNKVDKSY